MTLDPAFKTKVMATIAIHTTDSANLTEFVKGNDDAPAADVIADVLILCLELGYDGADVVGRASRYVAEEVENPMHQIDPHEKARFEQDDEMQRGE